MDLNKLMEEREKNIKNIVKINNPIEGKYRKEVNLVLDIEACPNIPFSEIAKLENMDKVKAYTYSIALMDISDDDDCMCWYNDVYECLKMLLNIKSNNVNIYVHNLFYDIKPFIACFINKFNATQVKQEITNIEENNYYTGEKLHLKKIIKSSNNFVNESYKYDFLLKNGQLYNFFMSGENFSGNSVTKINWKDTVKLFPLTLKAASKAFLDLELSKEGLDYKKVRDPKDILTFAELKYIYEDVFSLKYLVKKLCIEGFECFGKHVKYTKATNSGQSLYDYKETLLKDYKERKNAFANKEFLEEVENRLYNNGYFTLAAKKLKTEKGKESNYNKTLDKLFEGVYPKLNYATDNIIRKSYYGGLSYVDFDNVNKFKNRKDKKGKVFDVNSLYPFIMSSRLLPYGYPIINKNKPYETMSKEYKNNYPLYIQEIVIYDMKVKKGKMEFVQVKDRDDFNGTDVIKENINKEGKKVSIKLYLCNPLLELLFENYDIKSYSLGGHIAFRGSYNLFTNYLEFWAMVKQNSKGANRQIAKLRQNALYGKFGTSPDTDKVTINIDDDKLSLSYENDGFISDSLYIPISSFITSYAKQYLVQAINNNRQYFMYCDTDSIHLFYEGQEIKGLEIDDKKYGCWDNELNFNDFVYLGSKRYAEKDVLSNTWNIKCCGLTDEIMKSIDDINVFGYCEYTQKEIDKLFKNDKLFSKEGDNYYYKDKECSKKIKGLIKSKKARIVSGGTLIIEQPYAIREKYIMFR